MSIGPNTKRNTTIDADPLMDKIFACPALVDGDPLAASRSASARSDCNSKAARSVNVD
jgi:hypothetical protein